MGKALHALTATAADGRLLRAAVLVTVATGLLLPIFAGLWQTARAGFGVLPVIDDVEPSLEPFAALLEQPGFGTALRLTLLTGLSATALSIMLSVGVCAAMHGRMTPQASGRLLTPFLAAPHAAMAIGLAFLLSPSGWIARALAPLMGWDRPPMLATVNDPLGLALILGLMVKEVPFLLLVILSALSQLPVRQHLAAGRSLGYGRGIVWIKVIMPQVWPLVRLPVMVVLAYSLSVVDMALILGPSNPPTLAVVLLGLFTAPDIGGCCRPRRGRWCKRCSSWRPSSFSGSWSGRDAPSDGGGCGAVAADSRQNRGCGSRQRYRRLCSRRARLPCCRC